MTGARRTAPAAWYMLLVVTIILIIAMIDRLSLTLLVEPIKTDLRLNDIEMSLLLGLSFALPFSAFGLPAGYLVDKYNRRLLMGIAATIWTLMTFASGLAPSFAWLFACRAGVGLGEAVLSPCAYSMIRDSFPPQRQSTAFGLHNIGGPIGAGLALIVVGGFAGMAFIPLPGLSALPTWRATLCVVGLGGLASVFLLATIREPERSAQPVGRSRDSASVAATMGHLRAHWPFYVSAFLSTALFGIASLGIAVWLPTALSRLFEHPIAEIGRPLGIVQIVAPITGLCAAIFVLGRVPQKDRARSTAIVGAIAMVASAIAIITAINVPSLQTSWVAVFIVALLHPWCGVVIAALLAWQTPSRMMGKIAAINFLMLGLVGMTGGPTLIPIIAGALFTGPAALAYGLALVCSVGYGCCAVAMRLAGAHTNTEYVSDLRSAEDAASVKEAV